jgi:23S rRNA pseudouridine1911/1915/1917 synthase
VRERRLQWVVPGRGGRLDVCLAGLAPEISRTRLQSLIRDGRVFVDGSVAAKTGLRLSGGERIVVTIPDVAPAVLAREDIPLDVIFENGDVLVVNKPAGMVVHPAAGHASGTLVNAALAHAPDMQGIGGELRPGVVHRLDKDTSGLILIAKNDPAMRAIQRQFKDRLVTKTYLALVDGHPPTPTGRIEASLGRDPRHRQRIAVVPASRGREASTTYRTVEEFKNHALVELHPETGRTHQLRVHLAFLGCPVTGDRVYGHPPSGITVPRQMLHAWKLELVLPAEAKARQFVAPLPSDFEQVLRQLR